MSSTAAVFHLMGDFRLAVRFRAARRIPDGDPLGIALETSSHNSRSFRAASRGAGALSFASSPRHFSRRPPTRIWRSQRRFRRCASGAGGRTCQSGAAPESWRVVLVQRTPPLRTERSGDAGWVSWGYGLARGAQLAQPERASHSGARNIRSEEERLEPGLGPFRGSIRTSEVQNSEVPSIASWD